MAIVEIAKIQVRRGQENTTGVPRLDGGEFAWAADTERLYIGLSRADGGARDANVRILTENDERNFFALGGVTSSTYVYKLGSYITAVDEYSEEVESTVQERLDDDDVVNIKRFGVIADGINDNTALVQLAIDRLFLDTMDFETSTGEHPSKTLYFPSGIYNLTATIYIPQNTKIVGDGIDKTIFKVVSTGTGAFQTCDYQSRKGIENYIHFDNTTTIDSVYSPKNISISNLTLEFDSVLSSSTWNNSLLSLDCADHAAINQVKFKGSYDLYQEDEVNSNYCGINLRGFTALTSDNVVIDNCRFERLYAGVKSNYDIINPIIQNCEFSDLVKGVAFNDPRDFTSSIGPRYGKIYNNIFTNISEQGIYVGETLKSTYHESKNNRFFNVGNLGSIAAEGYEFGVSVISFLSNGNTSINDHFERYQYQMDIGLPNFNYNPLILGRGTLQNRYFTTKNISLSTPLQNYITKLPVTGYATKVTIEYYISGIVLPTENDIDKSGKLIVHFSKDPQNVNWVDNSSFTEDLPLRWLTVVSSTYNWIAIAPTWAEFFRDKEYTNTFEISYNVEVTYL